MEYVNAQDEEERKEIRNHIFARFASLKKNIRALKVIPVLFRAILKDDWTKLDVDNPLEAVRETVFFRLAELCYLQDLDPLAGLLPAPEELFAASSELPGKLRSDANFRFLLKSGYEHMARVLEEQRVEEEEDEDDRMQE